MNQIILNEAKQIGTAGNIKLNPKNLSTGLEAQMSNAWITKVIENMEDQGGALFTVASLLRENRSKIVKTVTGVDRTTSEAVILKLANY